MSMHFEAEPETFRKARELRENETNAEKLPWEQLLKNKSGVRFRRQHPVRTTGY